MSYRPETIRPNQTQKKNQKIRKAYVDVVSTQKEREMDIDSLLTSSSVIFCVDGLRPMALGGEPSVVERIFSRCR